MKRRLCFAVWLLLAGVAVTAAALEPVNVTGTWKLDVKAPVGSGEATFILSQQGDKVSGSYKGPLGENQVSGSVRENKIVLSVTHEKGGKRLEETYEATVESKNVMKGTVAQQYMGAGTFAAKRE